jgi:acylphosphatase
MMRHLVITGRVQGVGYRASFQAMARLLELSGWVRNRLDGSVEAVISGEAGAIEKMLEWARRGPPLSRVDQVAVDELEILPIVAGEFETLQTV